MRLARYHEIDGKRCECKEGVSKDQAQQQGGGGWNKQGGGSYGGHGYGRFSKSSRFSIAFNYGGQQSWSGAGGGKGGLGQQQEHYGNDNAGWNQGNTIIEVL